MHDLRFQDFVFDATPAHFQGEQRSIQEIRLMVVDAVTGSIYHDWMPNIGSYFTSNDTLVWNDVGISRSRLGGAASTGEAVDICFLLKDTQDDHVWDVVVLAYRQALARQYRFGINGDSMLILGNHRKLSAQALAGSRLAI
jgi:S-adenosylmethionine:tRNA-ribosyltransferase-isomerase (queuine synthetase)